MKLSEFHYELPASCIAQEPAIPRDQSRLMVLDRKSKAIEHRHFYEMTELLRPGDALVVNATKVFPARLRGKKKTGGRVDVLLLSPQMGAGTSWRALVRGATRPVDLIFAERLEARMTERLSEGEWVLEFSGNHIRDYLDRHGEMPLPPYIRRSASQGSDVQHYQTVYAKDEGAVAAPTAGFHFTSALLQTLKRKDVHVVEIVLHVGWGTFRPVRVEEVEKHPMLPERYSVSQESAEALNRIRQNGGRVIAVGTTAVRTLETVCDTDGTFRAGSGQTNMFIYPGYSFKGVDALITNFHLPDSTPLLLACAFYAFDQDQPFSLKFAYEEAIREKYRFYSYGDAMFIL